MMLFRFGGTYKDGGTDGGKCGFWRGCTFVNFAAAAAPAKGTEQPRLPSHFQQAAYKRLTRELDLKLGSALSC